MKNLTIIIPVKEYDNSMDELLNRAVKSCADNNIILIGKNVGGYKYKNDDKSVKPNIKKIENTTENTSYQNNVNIAVDSVKTEYFSVLEYEDYVSDKWFNNVELQMEYDTEDIFCFLPLTEIVDYEDGKVLGYANEAVWATSFSQDGAIGYLDIKSLSVYLNFNTSGGVFKTDEFIRLGGLKNSMKLVFWLEFLKRALYNGKLAYVIPKVGYYHMVNKEDSLTSMYAKEMSDKEVDWWVDLSDKEYFFKKDRNKTYEE
jgi:hypothetical protein